MGDGNQDTGLDRDQQHLLCHGRGKLQDPQRKNRSSKQQTSELLDESFTEVDAMPSDV